MLGPTERAAGLGLVRGGRGDRGTGGAGSTPGYPRPTQRSSRARIHRSVLSPVGISLGVIVMMSAPANRPLSSRNTRHPSPVWQRTSYPGLWRGISSGRRSKGRSASRCLACAWGSYGQITRVGVGTHQCPTVARFGAKRHNAATCCQPLLSAKSRTGRPTATDVAQLRGLAPRSLAFAAARAQTPAGAERPGQPHAGLDKDRSRRANAAAELRRATSPHPVRRPSKLG
jgi:hypothetical protein